MAKKLEVELPKSNLVFKGFGKDSNGNKVAKFTILPNIGVSIQTNGNMKQGHKMKNDDFDKDVLAKEAIAYIKDVGSKKQKDGLKTQENVKVIKIGKNDNGISEGEYVINEKNNQIIDIDYFAELLGPKKVKSVIASDSMNNIIARMENPKKAIIDDIAFWNQGKDSYIDIRVRDIKSYDQGPRELWLNMKDGRLYNIYF